MLGSREVRADLQNASMASLLPPVGTEVFRRFTAASLEEIQRRHDAEEKEQQKKKEMNMKAGRREQQWMLTVTHEPKRVDL